MYIGSQKMCLLLMPQWKIFIKSRLTQKLVKSNHKLHIFTEFFFWTRTFMWMYLRKNKQKFREIDFYLILWVCWAWIFLNFLAHCGYLFSFSKVYCLHIPNVYSHTLFYFCLQFEFHSLSFLMFFLWKT